MFQHLPLSPEPLPCFGWTGARTENPLLLSPAPIGLSERRSRHLRFLKKYQQLIPGVPRASSEVFTEVSELTREDGATGETRNELHLEVLGSTGFMAPTSEQQEGGAASDGPQCCWQLDEFCDLQHFNKQVEG